MVFCTPLVAAASTAGGAGATALGLHLDKRGVDLTKECFLLQMRQSKRMFAAGWAEASYRHGEQLAQAAQQHAESLALATAQYYQAEKINSQAIKVARDQDSRNFEMAWRTEARESLRDELTNQFNRYNTILLCNTVCLGCIYAFVVEGIPAAETERYLISLYLSCMGGSITLFTISLWICVVIIRRLHEHTAGILERKLFANDDELQKQWQYELEENLPTGHTMLNLVNEAYQQWLSNYISPLGDSSLQLMSIGVVLLFVTGGLLTHSRYTVDFDTPVAVYIFWASILVTSITLLWFKGREDSYERTKQGVYDKSWLDTPTTRGPLAKIVRAANELYSSTARRLGSLERSREYHSREKVEQEYVPNSKLLHDKSEALMSQAELRADTRQKVLEALTNAVEELDALPEDMIERLNTIIHDVDDADRNTAQGVTMPSKLSAEQMDAVEEDDMYQAKVVAMRSPMPDRPIDAQRTPVSLTSLRKKLGEIRYTTMVRIRNLSTEPLRLKSGVKLESGKYIKDLDVTLIASRHNRTTGIVGSKVCYHLYPIEEIPPRTEAVIVARSGGMNLVPTTGIEGQLVFANKDESWYFRVTFVNQLGGGERSCHTKASRRKPAGAFEDKDDNDGDNLRWIMSHETVDQDSNNEVMVTIDQQVTSAFAIVRHNEPTESLVRPPPVPGPFPISHAHCSEEFLKQGHLMKQEVVRVAMRVFWMRQWCVLSHMKLSIFDNQTSTTPDFEIRMMDIVEIRAHNRNGFRIISKTHSPVTFSAPNEEECRDWIQNLSLASGNDVLDSSRNKHQRHQQPFVDVVSCDKQQSANRTVLSDTELTLPSFGNGGRDNGNINNNSKPPMEIETLPV